MGSSIDTDKVWTVEELLKKETFWYSGYNESERWISDMKESFYSLVGEYELEKNLVLYRFELDESHRKDLEGVPSHFQNVIINKSLPPFVISEATLAMHKRR